VSKKISSVATSRPSEDSLLAIATAIRRQRLYSKACLRRAAPIHDTPLRPSQQNAEDDRPIQERYPSANGWRFNALKYLSGSGFVVPDSQNPIKIPI